MTAWLLKFSTFTLLIASVICCYKKETTYVGSPHQLVPPNHPLRALGWEQMLLMFKDPQNESDTQTAFGLAHSGQLCSFDFKLGKKFDPGAGIVPTHGGFLMCGRKDGYFSCCYWANMRYAIMNQTCQDMPVYFDKIYDDKPWTGGIILATDNNLEQYQSTLYAFFQGSGEIYVGGIIWSVENKWIINWVNIGNQLQVDDGKRAREDPCMVVVGSDLFVIGGLNSGSQRISNSWGYRLSKKGTWFEVRDYLMTERANAACIVDKHTKDIFAIGGNKEGSPTIEIGRYLANQESVYDRFIGYKCKNEPSASEQSNCYHIQLDDDVFHKGYRMYAFQLDNDDGNAYKTVVIGMRANGSDTKPKLAAIRLHNDKQRKFPRTRVKTAQTASNDKIANWFEDIGTNTFHVVPMKTIGFRACMKQVPFRKHGKLTIESPDAPEHYVGYWWDKKNQQPKYTNTKDSEDEYYYFLNPTYLDS